MNNDKYQKLSDVTRTHVTTAEAAFYLSRKVQTLRIWACGSKDVPIRPIKVGNFNLWSVAELRALLGQ